MARLLLLTSTYPRWPHDTTPGFVADFASNIAGHVSYIHVLAPHYIGAARHETTDNLAVTRYRYFLPASAEDIAYNGGAISKIKATPLYAIKLVCFMTALFFNTLILTIRHRITIINAHWLIPQGFVGVLVKFLTRRTLVITVHGGDVLSLNGTYMNLVKRFTLRHADIVCVNSSVTKAACKTLFDRDYVVIPMGIDIDRFHAASPSKTLKKRYGLKNFTILFVGRLSREKGVIYLLEALVKLKTTGKDFKALIVGTGPLAKELQTYITAHALQGEVTIVGWVDNSDLPRYYSTADIMVGPSLHEAQGLVFLEALAAGLPVITTNQGGMQDFMKDGENGFMVPPESSDTLYQKLVTLYDDRALLRAMAKNAASSVKQRYSWNAVTKRYVAVFKGRV